MFFLVRVTGDPAEAFAPTDATSEDIQRIAAGMGLDKPLYVQYLYFYRDLFTGKTVSWKDNQASDSLINRFGL